MDEAKAAIVGLCRRLGYAQGEAVAELRQPGKWNFPVFAVDSHFLRPAQEDVIFCDPVMRAGINLLRAAVF
ncbi:hypothetical protein [Aquitalea palustris]|uniref:hypothetical protein n=1 Tax=Aquitalea palustris TaxID=2480983 RepID=UPI0011C49576|nr:hypothetical protein [Aquitalea palustris]